MPGGPTDPTKVLDAIANGAIVREGNDHFDTAEGDRWPRVDAGAWELADTATDLIGRDTFVELQSASLEMTVGSSPVPTGYLLIGGLRYELARRELCGAHWAILEPA